MKNFTPPENRRNTLIYTVLQAVIITALAFGLSALMMQPVSLSVATLVSSNDRTDFNITDFYNIVADSRKVRTLDPEIVLVDIGDATRDDIADLFDAIPAFEPRAVGVDISFEEERPGDVFLIDALSSNPNLVMVVDVEPDRALNGTRFRVSGGSYFLDHIPGVAVGAANLPTKIPGGVVRNFVVDYPAADSGAVAVNSFPVAVAQLVAPDAVEDLRARGRSQEFINYPSRTYRVISYNELADKGELLTDKIVLVGALTDEGDLHATPPQIRMAGLEIHAHALSTILHREYLHELSSTSNLVIACVLCFLLALTHVSLPAAYKSLVLRIVQLILLYLLLRVGYYYFVEHKIIINFSYALLMLTFVFFACDIWFSGRALFLKYKNRTKKTDK